MKVIFPCSAQAEALGLEKGPTFPSTLNVPNTEAKLGFYKLRKKRKWFGVENRRVCLTMYQLLELKDRMLLS